MAVRHVSVADIGQIAIYKRRGVRSVKLSVTHEGSVRVTLPVWAPYRLAVEFALDKIEWIHSQRKPKAIIRSGDRVGKAHRFVFENRAGNKPSSRIRGTDIVVFFSSRLAFNDPLVQAAAEKAAIRALKKEAEQLLPQRLQTLAAQHGFTYDGLKIKRLKSRWGSCNDRQEITLNLFLMQLPWHLIDYVILHELTHTRVLQHGPKFWNMLGKHIRNLLEIRKEIKSHQTVLVTTPGPETKNDILVTDFEIAVDSI